MTKINRMVMNGFKSFGKRVEMVFEDRFNCILGPNGSGKSNVLDSLCFVLGKSSAKGLRAEKSANLIYNGGKSKNPAKQGEVSIFFDNSQKEFPVEGKEVKITRIIKQSGQSIYKINDKTRTRQQVLDLLSAAKIDPDAYNIILQGDIIKFVEMSPLEKRQIIEEISGISIYEEKKNKALSELTKVEERLGEASIILKERSTYLKELKKDRDQALKYRDLNDKINQNKASFLKIQIDQKEEVRKKLDSESDQNTKSIEKKQSQTDELKKKISANRDQVKEITKEIEEKGEKDQLKMQKDIEQLRVDIATNKTRVSTLQNELVRIEQRKNQLQQNLSDVNEKTASFTENKNELAKKKDQKQKEKTQIEAKIDEFKKKHKIDSDSSEIDSRIEEIDKKTEESQKEIQQLREEQQELLRLKDKNEFQIQTIDQQIKKVAEIEKENRESLNELKNKRELFKKVTLDLNKALNLSSSLAAELQHNEKKLRERNEELAKLNIRNAGIKEKISGSIAVKKILEQKSKFKGVYGTVSELGKVSSKYAVAMEVAAGNKIYSVVCEDDAVAARCIKYLKDNKLGTATFLPLNKIRGISVTEADRQLAKAQGAKGLAIDLISFQSKFKKVFEYVLGSTIIVDNIDVARRIGIGKARMATLTGDIAEITGAMKGGFRAQSGVSFQEKELSSNITDMESELADLSKAISILQNDIKENDEEIMKMREQKAELEGEIIRMEKSLHLKSDDLNASKKYKEDLNKETAEADKKLSEMATKITSMNRDLANLKMEKQKLRDKITQLRNPRLLAELNTFEEKKAQLAELIASIDSEMKGIALQMTDILGRDKDNIAKILKDIDKEEKGFKEEIKLLNDKMKDQAKDLKELEKQQEKFYSQHKALFAKRNKLNDEITKIDKEIDDIMDKLRKEEIRNNSVSIENAKIKAELAGLKEEFAQYEGVKLNLSKPIEELKKEIRDFEKLKESIGMVNLRALEIYETIEKEYNSLIEKEKKLMKEKEDLISMMEEIETKKTDLFMKTFDNINENFKRIFSTLSTKGQAFIELENKEKPLEGGIFIKVRLTGNKYLDIRSLSGGEKTMTALAFIFAVQEYEPATFYVLDEVDAALDKHNSEKLAKLVAKYSDRAQYIIISHNDAVISEADVLYGSSMDEHGVTKIVSLKI